MVSSVRALFGVFFGAAVWSASGCALATEVALAGVFGAKAVLVVNGGQPKTLAAGQKTKDGVTLVSVDGDAAIVEVNGVRERLRLGERVVRGLPGGDGQSVYLEADGRGHFVTTGLVNGVSTSFLVDTGATLVSIGMSDARRMGIDIAQGQPGVSQTANGVTRVWHVKLDSIKVGQLVLYGVDAAIHANDLPVALLGMSFLNRMEMNRDGSRLVLKKRY